MNKVAATDVRFVGLTADKASLYAPFHVSNPADEKKCPCMNKLYVGFTKEIELPKGGYLLIADEAPDFPKPKIFDPAKHSFNPLKGLTPKRAREITSVLYSMYPQGSNTLTVRKGQWALAPALVEASRLDKVRGDEEVSGLVGDLLFSPVLRRVFCEPPNFLFNPVSKICARLNRAELGEFDCLTIGLMLLSVFRGQIVLPSGGFYLRDAHASLIRENRLIFGVNTLSELPPKLRQRALLIEEKVPSGTTIEDAETLAGYARLMTFCCNRGAGGTGA